MTDSNVPEEMTEHTGKRLRKLAFAKSKLELVLRMMIQLSKTSGLENVIKNGLEAIMEAVGATNIVLFYRHGLNYVRVDVFGEKSEMKDLEDSHILGVYKDKVPRIISSSYHNTQMTFQTREGQSYTWIYPLLSNEDVLGVIKVENTIYGTQGYDDALDLFFSYFAQQLRNELQNTEKLQQINNKLKRLNRELEKRVQQRTHELEKSNKNLKKSEERYRSILESMRDAAYISSSDYYIEYMNPKMIQQVGRNACGQHCYKAIHNLDGKCSWCVSDEIQQGEFTEFELENSQDGRLYLISNSPVYNSDGTVSKLSIFRDITEAKTIEEQLRQAQKMESVGRLAGGVAHDFNNMLGVILGNTEMIMEEHGSDSLFSENLKEIKDASQRSADLVRQLLAFARKQTILPQVLNLNNTTAGMLKMLQRLIGENIDLKWLPAADLWQVKIDPSQIDQILANLCVNSRDAIKDQGKIIIETLNVTLDANDCKNKVTFNAGDYVMISFRDNGCGMDKDTLDNLFEPFFTTKDVGQGTGLGLATVYGIVEQNNGFIDVISEQDHGTTFKIYFPRFNQKAAAQDKIAEMIIEKGDETVLLVEDEKAILRMTAMMLERTGYKVISASSPSEAIRITEDRKGSEIQLLMTDVIMPEMNGWDLSKKLLHRFPDLKCLFMSGHPADVIAHHGFIDEGIEFIKKPFSKKDLAVKLRSIFDESK